MASRWVINFSFHLILTNIKLNSHMCTILDSREKVISTTLLPENANSRAPHQMYWVIISGMSPGMCTFNQEIPVLADTEDPLSYRVSLLKLSPWAHYCLPLSLQFLSSSWLRKFKSLNPTLSPAFIPGTRWLRMVVEFPHPPSSSQDYLRINIKGTQDMETLSSCLTLP